MAYHTLDELKMQIPEADVVALTDDADAGSVGTTVTTAAAQSAQDVIDAYLAGGYTLPLETVPGIVREISIALACHWLYFRRMPKGIPEAVEAKRRNAMDLLQHIMDGKLKLFHGQNENSSFRTNKTASDRDFPDSVLGQFAGDMPV